MSTILDAGNAASELRNGGLTSKNANEEASTTTTPTRHSTISSSSSNSSSNTSNSLSYRSGSSVNLNHTSNNSNRDGHQPTAAIPTTASSFISSPAAAKEYQPNGRSVGPVTTAAAPQRTPSSSTTPSPPTPAQPPPPPTPSGQPMRPQQQPPKSVALMKIKTYLLALRPWSLSASLMPTILGSALAYRTPGPYDFSPLTFVLTVFTVITVHGAGNVVNTYFDFIKGIDTRKSDDRTLVDHILSKDEVVSLGAILYMAGCAGFIALAILSPAKMEHLALVYFGGLSSSFLYTGGIGLKYIALGDVLILVIFGPISVLFAYMAQTGRLEWTTIYFAIPLALNTEAILHSNNTRDADTDRRAGIVTLAILIGRTASHILYALLLFTPYSVFVVLSLKYSGWFLLPLITVPQAFKIEKQFRNVATLQSVPKQTASLNFYFGILYVVACCCAPQLPLIARRF